MPTLEEQIAALEHAQSIMKSEQMDTRQIDERITALQQQINEQKKDDLWLRQIHYAAWAA